MITVFYDAKCGLCAREIKHYRKIAPENVFNWQDVNESAKQLAAKGISLADGLELLHALDANGELHVGVDAFILIWSQLKRWRLLAWFVGLPIIHTSANLFYKIFAHWRFKRLAHCQIAAQQVEQECT